MIQVAGSAHRTFVFPADLPTAYAYYSDVGRLLHYLPHICLVRAYGPDRFRMLYSTTELGTYRVRIFVDVQTRLEAGWVLRVESLDGPAPVKARAGINSSTAQGFFASRSVFHDAGDATLVEYGLRLRADLPTPLGLRFMPGAVVNHIAGSITHKRIREIADGFIERTIAAFPHWLAEMKHHHPARTIPQDRSDCPQLAVDNPNDHP